LTIYSGPINPVNMRFLRNFIDKHLENREKPPKIRLF